MSLQPGRFKRGREDGTARRDIYGFALTHLAGSPIMVAPANARGRWGCMQVSATGGR
jgi:hypothetical protein